MSAAASPQPDPQPGQQVVLSLVIDDLQARARVGRVKYGTLLMTHNGRDALMDSYQEALDLVMYLRQAIAERSVEVQAVSEDILARYAALRARLDQPVTVTELVGEAFREVYDYAVHAEYIAEQWRTEVDMLRAERNQAIARAELSHAAFVEVWRRRANDHLAATARIEQAKAAHS